MFSEIDREGPAPTASGLLLALPGTWLVVRTLPETDPLQVVVGLVLVVAGGCVFGFVIAEDRLASFGAAASVLIGAAGVLWAWEHLARSVGGGPRLVGYLLFAALMALVATLFVALPFVVAGGVGARLRGRLAGSRPRSR